MMRVISVSYDFDILVIGGGHTGVEAALAIRKMLKQSGTAFMIFVPLPNAPPLQWPGGKFRQQNRRKDVPGRPLRHVGVSHLRLQTRVANLRRCAPPMHVRAEAELPKGCQTEATYSPERYSFILR